jgi:hypothetical protein
LERVWNIKEFMNELLTELFQILKPILGGILLFKLIEFLTDKISIREYYINTQDESLNDIKITWFNSGGEFNGNKIYKYRFEVKSKTDKYLIFIDRRNLMIIDKIKLILWLFKEYILNKIDRKRQKELCSFLVDSYIIPEYTQLSYNLKVLRDVKDILDKNDIK